MAVLIARHLDGVPRNAVGVKWTGNAVALYCSIILLEGTEALPAVIAGDDVNDRNDLRRTFDVIVSASHRGGAAGVGAGRKLGDDARSV